MLSLKQVMQYSILFLSSSTYEKLMVSRLLGTKHSVICMDSIGCTTLLLLLFYSLLTRYGYSVHLQRYVADVGKAWPVLLVCGGLLPLFLSIIWLLMIRHFVAGMPWVTVIVFNILMVSVTMFYYLKGLDTIY